MKNYRTKEPVEKVTAVITIQCDNPELLPPALRKLRRKQKAEGGEMRYMVEIYKTETSS